MSAKTVTVTAPVQRTPLSRPVSRGVPTEELFILVLGQPGVGKTSFINTVSNSTLRISSGADGAEGEKLELSLPFFVDGKAVRLIDTPAFGDPNKSDTEVLTAIASYLASEYTNSRKLAGVIYLHSIAATRLRGPGRRNLSLFTKLCGKQALANVAIVTTRWDQVDLRSGEAREVELQSKPTLLKPLVEAGATLFRYIRSDDVAALSSAQNIIRYFLHRPALPLLVQQEMVDDGQLIPETTAGRALHKEYRTQLDELQKNMQDLRLEYDELKKENRMATARKVKSEMIAIKEAAEKLKEESKKLSGAKMTILPSQPLKLLISPTAVEQATAAAQPRARRPPPIASPH
ncbi:hypothetical protein CC1G_11210 [Coprinopsis cinerea okayama7|uniref:G domain-containing protein n=1 Tax=Coprinopsis cinerea (strain Okayama-7 / 130 / ATCC MYA-4618 / FGSC 9003) TaxID=240176 RepID=A8NJU4_COPC7|nr:hypothetical protein CC1G_11210 [Coprinopsis cinerea okayama7\|eukprot:XP_001834297.2 hypothetical protein CC1G_11210 [Coprinopsis cinerea okayama7\